MKQYIDKATLVAEIERLISNGQVKLQESQESNDDESYVVWSEHIATCIKVLSFIDALEVKEVQEEPVSKDLEEAADNYVGHAPEIDEDLSCFTKRNAFIAGAQWKKEQCQKTIELAEDHAYLAGQEKVIEKACEWLKSHYRDYMYNPTGERLEAFFGGDMCNDFENYMMEK